MSNVGFKTGTQAVLDSLLIKGSAAKADEGSFYLASDTRRLYIGNADGSISPVNQGVLTVDKIRKTDDLDTATALPSAALAEQTGNFYYIKEGNILCVATGGRWVQINSIPDIEMTWGSF